MKALNNWVLWKYENREDSKGNVKKTKVPYQVNGKKAESTNPDTWGNIKNILKTLERYLNRYDGIGFVFSPDSDIMGLDFDHVIDIESGEWDQEALKEIKSLNSYTEISPSGEGVHVIAKGQIPFLPEEIKAGKTGKKNQDTGREMYHSGRFFTITGDLMEGAAKTINPAQGAVNALYYKWFNERNKKKNTGEERRAEKKIKLSNSEIIEIASRAKNSATFKSLYSGGISSYGSQSEADLALCSLLAFYTQDESQLDELFRGSGLYRDKWERDDYRNDTINKALQGVTKTYSPDKKGNSGKEKPDKILVHWDEVGDRILKENHIFSMRDNGQIYLYQGGVYSSKDTETILGTWIRNTYFTIYMDRWEEQNPNKNSPGHIPKATTKFVNEVLAYIRAYTHITRDSIEADQAKHINFKNCLFNLETWKIEDHNPNIKSICQIPVCYDETAECPRISKFLEDIVAEPDLDLLNEIAGYCLTTDCSYQKAFMLYGVGSNGKSVFLALLEALIGGENTSAESLQKLEFDKYRTAKLYGKRVNICGDIPDSKMHKSEVFKKLTSGLDLIDGENKYQDSFVFRNTAKLVFSANILPEGKKDKAYYRRWVLINFPNNFEGKNDDKDLIKKLRNPEELSGFLNLALEGLKRLKENGKFTNEKSIEETQKEYEFNSDPIAAFMDEWTQVSEEDCDATILYLTYVEWCQLYSKPHMSNIGFSRKLNSMGYTSHRDNAPGSNSNKKIPKWDNLKIKQDRIGQDRTRCENGKFLSCPSLSNNEKTEIGQDGNSFVDLHNSFLENDTKKNTYVSTQENSEKGQNSEILLTRKDSSCPKMRFFDDVSHRTGYEDKIENYPVLQTKITFLTENNEVDITKKLVDFKQLKRDLTNSYSTYLRNYGGLESLNVFVDDFMKKMPGYLKLFSKQEIVSEAAKICKVAIS